MWFLNVILFLGYGSLAEGHSALALKPDGSYGRALGDKQSLHGAGRNAGATTMGGWSVVPPAFATRLLRGRKKKQNTADLKTCDCGNCESALRNKEEQGSSKATYKCQPVIGNDAMCSTEINEECGETDLQYTRFCVVYCRPVLKKLFQQCIDIQRKELDFTESDDCLGRDPHLLTKVESDQLTAESIRAAASAESPDGMVATEAMKKAKRAMNSAKRSAEDAKESFDRLAKLT